MDIGLYNKEIICPVCSKKFEITKVKTKACKVLVRDSDFCTHYEGINPLFYDVWVCENCGHASQADKFQEISTKDSKLVQENITPRWNKRSFAGERNIDHAIEAFKLALFNLQVRKAKGSDMAKICLRISWLYRIKKDEKEKDFMNYALKFYGDTYQKETFPVEKLDDFTCMYMIAELNRRIGNIDDSVKWFSRIISSPEARKNPQLVDNAREQFHLAKEQIEKGNNATA